MIVLSIILVLSLTKTDLGDQDDDSMRVKSIEEVLREHTDGLMSIPGVVGTAQGICNNKPCIKVFVIKKTKDIDQSIPDELDGYPVEVEETGEFKALPQN
jgi:hypothetical protein